MYSSAELVPPLLPGAPARAHFGVHFLDPNRADDMRHVTVRVALCPPKSGSRKWTRFWVHGRSPKIDLCVDV